MSGFDNGGSDRSRQLLENVRADDGNGDDDDDWPQGGLPEDDGDETSVILETLQWAREALEEASDQEREEMADLIEKIKVALKAGDIADAAELAAELEEILFDEESE